MKNNFSRFIQIFPAFVILVASFLILERFTIFNEIGIMIEKGRGLSVLVYVSTYLFCTFSFLLLLKASSKLLRYVSIITLCISIFIDNVYRSLNGRGIGYEDILLAKQNAGFGFSNEILASYGADVFLSVLISIGVTFIIWASNHYWRKIYFKSYLGIAGALLGVLVCFGIMKHSVMRRTTMPSPFKIAALLSYASIHNLYSGERDKPYFNPEGEAVAPHVVWIVDESVRGDMLQINGYQKATTPFLQSMLNTNLINFGVASSSAICSDYSHIMLIGGAQLSDLPDSQGLLRKRPTIFQYCEQLEMSSNLIYGPGYDQLPKSYMTKYDYQLIDNKYFTKLDYPHLLNYEIDYMSISFLESIIENSEKSFTYFLKYGVHTHYENTYPPSKRVFKPVMNLSDLDDNNREEMINSYCNGLLWEVDSFFSELYSKFKNQNIIFIYTSDHGQNLLDDPKVRMSHCVTDNPPHQMANVPLFIFTTQETTKHDLSKLVSLDNVNCASHFNIFSSTLKFMGYPDDKIKNFYGLDLSSNLCQQDRLFTYGDIFGRGRFDVKSFPRIN